MFKYAKWCINDRCNLSCPFCIMDQSFKEQTIEEQYKVLDKLYDMGIISLDFFGKEVLFDDRMLKLWDYMLSSYKDFLISFITNGVNLEKYKREILHFQISTGLLTNITVSTDFGVSRQFIPREDIFDDFRREGIYTEFSVDLQRNNLQDTIELIESGNSDSVFIKPIMPYGKRADYSKSVMINTEEIYIILDALDEVESPTDVFVSLPFIITTRLEKNYKNIEVLLDEQCTCGNSLFITAEGKVYGCGNLANTSSTRYCDFLTTPAEEIYSHICKTKMRECIL